MFFSRLRWFKKYENNYVLEYYTFFSFLIIFIKLNFITLYLLHFINRKKRIPIQ